MQAALTYYRVSTEEQATEGKSLETQKKLCLKWAQDNNYTVADEYHDDGKSGTSLNRPALKELLARCQDDKTIKAVIIQDTDRLARNTLDHLTIKALLKKLGIELISVSQPMIDSSPEGNLIDTIIASVNAFQSQITGRKTSKVLEQKAKMGWWPGGLPPLGYRNVENPNPTSTLDKNITDIDPEAAPYMKRAFALYSTGQYSAQTLVGMLTEQGLRSKSGGTLNDSVLINYLQNPFYIGKMRWRNEVLPANHPPLIDEGIFNLCQEILTSHNQSASRTRKHNYLLRGYVYCYDCGKRLWADKHTKKNGLVYELYFCKTCGAGTYIDKDKLEKQVERQFERIQITKGYALHVMEVAEQLLKDFRDGADQERTAIHNRKAKLEAAMREAEDDRFVHHTLTAEAFDRIYPRYEKDLAAINCQLSNLEDDHSQKVSILQKVMALAQDIGNAYKTAEPNLKRIYLELFWEGFDIKAGKIAISRLHNDLKHLLLNSSSSSKANWAPPPRFELGTLILTGFRSTIELQGNI